MIKPHKHGMYGTPEYVAFHDAKQRCINSKDQKYPYYGGRGIKFLFDRFLDFYNEVGPRPSAKHSLDRIRNEGDYEKGNVRWATKKQQMNNCRTRARKVKCVETGQQFYSLTLAAKYYKTFPSNILRAIKTGGTAGGVQWR